MENILFTTSMDVFFSFFVVLQLYDGGLFLFFVPLVLKLYEGLFLSFVPLALKLNECLFKAADTIGTYSK